MSKSYSLGLIGYPLGHSLSPHMHRAALAALDLQGDYQLYEVEPATQGQAELEDLLEKMRSGKIHGLNVTIPHKQNVIQYLDELTPTAEAIGAVNTMFLENGSLVGDNTDAPAFLAEVKHLDLEESQKVALVLGAGGSARAVVYALISNGWQAKVLARKVEQAQEVVAHFGERVHAFVWDTDQFEELGAGCKLIVNTTPIGMFPNIDASPWPMDLPFPQGAAVYDLVYNPAITQFVRLAREQGLLAQTGAGMLVEQAALAFERWTGHNVPRDIMRQMFDKQLSLSEASPTWDSSS